MVVTMFTLFDQTLKQSPGPQSSHSADRPRHAPHTSGPPTSRHHQTDRPTRRSSQPSPSRLQQRHSVPPGKGSTKGPSGSDCHGGARRKRPTTSRNTGQGASQSARKARCPAKKASFDPKTFRHATDLSAWAESLNCASYIPDDELEDDGPYVQVSTLRREAEAEHYDMLTFPPDFEDELTDCSEDEARQHVSSEDSIYDSLSSMSLESMTDMTYETAAEITPDNCSPVPEPGKTASPKGSSESLETKNSSQALSAESVYNSIVFSARQRTSQAVNAESIHNSNISSRAEICAQETLLRPTASCKTTETDLPAATSMTLEIKGLPKGTTTESLYETCFLLHSCL
ncbi:uncharacterized protein LOC119436151 isoform X3 [Dermacentor silvarum]|uniref:uncharacterized protein LOC119436151 isoform X3 n=1 Tax=Dermacentor silvarum TaxID=543639 RepID=UPI0021018D34|nr:uncharacterized protein LOC119436151 isoform X3 [Dermacentor silvarum]